MSDVKHLMKDHFLRYASKVILDRAIPKAEDGLKPVQRRILHTLLEMHDGKMHKVANVAGQTMAYHPHGDAPIVEALVNLANKGYLLETQGNFGNIYTGDSSAAARYIETRLSPLAKETLFNKDLTETMLSYDSRREEPVCFPAKIPLLLMQGADGIAVGMSTRVLPHNFVELLEAEIAYFEDKTFTLLPDFIQGGIMDASEYDQGRGKVKLRAKIEVPDPKTIVITEVCYGTTTESLTRSIDEAAKKGKIKIDSINDYTAEKVEIEIKLPRGQYAQDVIDELYAYTECEVSLNSQIVVIKGNMPIETTVNELLILHANLLQGYLKRELELEQERLKERVFEKTLERIFIENRMYKKIEEIASYEKIHETIMKSLEPFHKELSRIPVEEDRERLLSIPIRRISRFDLNKNQEDILALLAELASVEKHLKNVKRFTINYLKGLIAKYGKEYPRRTKLQEIEELDRRAIETKTIKVGFDVNSGFVGTKVAGESFECTNFDKLLAFFSDGTYRVINIPEKQYLPKNGSSLVFIGPADKKSVMSVVSKEVKSNIAFAKRFIVDKFILDKEYRYFEEGHQLEMITIDPKVSLTLNLVPKVGQKMSKIDFQMGDVLVKGVSAKGVRMTSRQVKKVVLK